MKQFKTINQNKADIEIGYKQEIKLEEVFNDEKKENIKKFIDEIENPSQPNQALEEAAERISKEHYVDQSDYWAVGVDSFKRGAKWQQERSYSEEDMIEFGKFIFKNTLLVNVKGVEGILEQFKKK